MSAYDPISGDRMGFIRFDTVGDQTLVTDVFVEPDWRRLSVWDRLLGHLRSFAPNVEVRLPAGRLVTAGISEDDPVWAELAEALSTPSRRPIEILPPAHELYGGFIQEGSDRRLWVDGKPLQKLYRVVDPGEWADAQANGYLQSSGGGGGYTRASAKPDDRWRNQMGGGTAILEIDYDPADGWHASAEGYAATRSRIPLSRVRKIGVAKVASIGVEEIRSALKDADLPTQARDGDCFPVSGEVRSALRDHGIEGEVVSVWGKIEWPGDPTQTVIGIGHAAVQVGGLIVDATATQYDPSLPSLIIAPLGQYTELLGKATGTTVTVGHFGKVASAGKLYHGTNVALAPGDHILPATQSGRRNFDETYEYYDPNYVYMSDQVHLAERFARSAARKHGGKPHVYLVRPSGSAWPDPEGVETGFGTDQWVTRMATVIEEVPLTVMAKVASIEQARAALPEGLLREPHDMLYPPVWTLSNEMRSEARAAIYEYLAKAFVDLDPDIRLAVIGSGASYNWDEDGDLDVQVWCHPDLVKMLRQRIAPLNNPTTGELGMGGRMTVQFYVKPGGGTEAENLAGRPYACYDIDEQRWLVEPKPITPEFYADAIAAILGHAREVAAEAESLIAAYRRTEQAVAYWEETERPDLAAQERIELVRLHGEIKALFLTIFRARGDAYSPEGEGINDERDAMVKALEVWGIWGNLKHIGQGKPGEVVLSR